MLFCLFYFIFSFHFKNNLKWKWKEIKTLMNEMKALKRRKTEDYGGGKVFAAKRF